MASDDDENLIPPASPWPVVVAHLLALGLHVIDGLSAVVLLQLAPPPWDGAGEPMTTPRVWASGLAVFATIAAVGFSTGFTVIVYRTVSMFRKWSPVRRRATLAGGMLVAHALGCTAALAAIGLWIAATVLG